MKRILIADDDAAIRELLKIHFRAESGYQIVLAKDGKEALASARDERFDVLLLDLMMPYFSGIDIVKKLRAEDNFTPIIILTAREDDVSKLTGLKVGADDYLDKTTPMSEVVARADALIRRQKAYNKAAKSAFTANQLSIDFDKKAVSCDGKPLGLTKREYELLVFLVKKAGAVVSRDDLLQEFWGLSADEAETRTIDVLVGRLKKKLDGRFIRSKRGFGYYFDENA